MPYSYKTLIQALASVGIEEAASEALLLLERFAGVTTAALMTDRDRTYDSPALTEAVERRMSRYPLQYILGEWDFFGCRFAVSEHCLVPRPDTEILVEEAIRILPENARIVDLCTGSGCVAIATLVHRPDVTADALELYPDTLAIAAKNAGINQVADRFVPILADLLTDGREALAPRAPYDAILSNPPYIRTADIAALAPEVQSEPRAALDGGEDGLIFYRAILRDYAPLVRPGGHILLEIGFDQAADLQALCAELLPDATLRIVKDLGGNDRTAVVTLSKK